MSTIVGSVYFNARILNMHEPTAPEVCCGEQNTWGWGQALYTSTPAFAML
ncbi:MULTISPECIES: hypothetical protein [Rhodobacterales]|nr:MULTISPECIES: hypothetical protein [Rhodobacterales]MDO6590024.1 hypothetical protein [Yoonia sp. 1_MG-2023]